MTIVLEVIFEFIKKLYRFVGPAIFVALILVLEIIMMPGIADSKAATKARRSETNVITSFEEVGYDEEGMDRVFKLTLRNNGSDPNTFSSLYITREDGKSIYNSLKTEFEELRICGKHAIISYIPPGTESVAYLHIDDYALEGLDHIYIRALYSDDDKGTRFDIEKK